MLHLYKVNIIELYITVKKLFKIKQYPSLLDKSKSLKIQSLKIQSIFKLCIFRLLKQLSNLEFEN